LPYFGKWPIWFEAHLLSIAKNPTINWLIITDCKLPDNYPENIKFVNTNLQELNKKVNAVVEVNVPLTPRKFCDLKPAYGSIFKEYIENYDFWGFCDMDIIWGDIRKFITNDVLENYDIISSRKYEISGHFNLFKNTYQINNLYKLVPSYKKLFSLEKGVFFDEHHFSKYIQNNNVNGFNNKIFWSKILLNQERGRDSHQEYYLDKWQWQNGKMINIKNNEEVMYLHFINWKGTMNKCEVNYKDNNNAFYISYTAIHLKKHSSLEINFVDFRNKFWGYYQYERFELFKRKYKKKIKNKLLNK
jgi:hypothetical protein